MIQVLPQRSGKQLLKTMILFYYYFSIYGYIGPSGNEDAEVLSFKARRTNTATMAMPEWCPSAIAKQIKPILQRLQICSSNPSSMSIITKNRYLYRHLL